MKKLLFLCLGASLSYMGYAQQNVNGARQMGSHKADVAASDVKGNAAPSLSSNKKTRKTLAAFPGTFGTKEVVGRTTYDLQTNGSTQRRVLQNGNTISCGWTFSLEQNVFANASNSSSWADRGTGYAHYNGTSWSAAPTTRLESIRTGFGGFTGTSGATERYIAHDGTNNALYMSTKSAGTWTSAQMTTSLTNKAIWPHSASSGNWLYVLASSSDSMMKSNGIRYGYFFSRSNDNGATWIDNMIPLPLVDSVGHYRGGGNSYAITASGNNVAILCGDIGADLTLIKSTDNGATWTKSVIWNWPIDNYDFASATPTDYNNDAVVDTLWTTDGSQSMTMDAAGKIHVAFPVVRVYKTGANTGYNFFYSTLLAYWNEDMAVVADSVLVVDNIFSIYRDCDGDQQFGIGQNYTSATDGDGIYNTIGLISMPSITTTSTTPPKIMIAYTAVMDNDTTVDDFAHPFWFGASALEGQNYRDVFVIGTENGNWGYPVNISRTAHFEEAYPSVAENVSGNNLAVLYQADIEPGTILQNYDTYDPNFENLMICQVVKIDSVFILAADSSAPCGQSELPLALNQLTLAEGSVDVYPNPAADYVNVNLNLVNTSGVVTYEIADMTGKVVYSERRNNLKSGMNRISLHGLATGAYILKISTDSGVYSEKLLRH